MPRRTQLYGKIVSRQIEWSGLFKVRSLTHLQVPGPRHRPAKLGPAEADRVLVSCGVVAVMGRGPRFPKCGWAVAIRRSPWASDADLRRLPGMPCYSLPPTTKRQHHRPTTTPAVFLQLTTSPTEGHHEHCRLRQATQLLTLSLLLSLSRAPTSQNGCLAFPSAPGVAQCGNCKLPLIVRCWPPWLADKSPFKLVSFAASCCGAATCSMVCSACGKCGNSRRRPSTSLVPQLG